jgi:hypothetical protein
VKNDRSDLIEFGLCSQIARESVMVLEYDAWFGKCTPLGFICAICYHGKCLCQRIVEAHPRSQVTKKDARSFRILRRMGALIRRSSIRASVPSAAPYLAESSAPQPPPRHSTRAIVSSISEESSHFAQCIPSPLSPSQLIRRGPPQSGRGMRRPLAATFNRVAGCLELLGNEAACLDTCWMRQLAWLASFSPVFGLRCAVHKVARYR